MPVIFDEITQAFLDESGSSVLDEQSTGPPPVAGTDRYQAKYLHFLIQDPSLQLLSLGKIGELRALIQVAGQDPDLPDFPLGTVLASAATGNGDTAVLTSQSSEYINDVLLRITVATGATPTATMSIRSAKSTTFANCLYAPIVMPQAFVTSDLVFTSAGTYIYRIPPMKARYLKVTVSANTNVTYTIDAWNYGGGP